MDWLRSVLGLGLEDWVEGRVSWDFRDVISSFIVFIFFAASTSLRFISFSLLRASDNFDFKTSVSVEQEVSVGGFVTSFFMLFCSF